MDDKLAKLPRGWVWTEIGNIGEIITGTTPSKSINEYYGKDFPFYKPTDLNEGYYVRKSEDGLSKKGINKGRLLPAKSILVTCIGATIGKTGFIRKAGASNQQINAIIPKRGVVPEYIFFSCISPQIQKSIINNASSTTLPILNKTKFEKLSIPIPPFPEQNRIVFKIEELFTKLGAGVEALKKVKAQLKRYRQAVLKYAFEGKLTQEWREANKDKLEPASALLEKIKEERRNNAKGKLREFSPLNTSGLSELPKEWAWTRLGEISLIILGQSPPSSTYNENGEGLPFYQGKLEFGEIYPVPQKWCSSPKKIAEKGDVLISVRAPVGPTNICPGKSCIGRGLAALRGMGGISPFFILYLIRAFENNIAQKGTGTTFNAITGDQLNEFRIPLPSLIEQNKIVENIESCFSIAHEVEKIAEQTLKQSERLRQSILKTAFEGKLVPQNSTDEPAEKLLERIKAEKAKKESETKGRRKKSNQMEPK